MVYTPLQLLKRLQKLNRSQGLQNLLDSVSWARLSNEEKARLCRWIGKGEPSDRALDVQLCADRKRQVRARFTILVEPDQQFEPAFASHVFG